MAILLLYTLNIVLLFSCFLHYSKYFQTNALGFALLQSLISLPLLATEYIYFAYNINSRTGELIFFSEAVFIVIWLNLAKNIQLTDTRESSHLTKNDLIEIASGLAFLVLTGYILETQLLFILSEKDILLPRYGAVYFLSILTLLMVLFSSWKIEEFWRSLSRHERWKYRLLIAGSFLICGALAWNMSYRLTYMTIHENHLLLLAALILSGWTLMLYDFLTHNLLTKQIYISRKAVYSSLFPTLLAIYFIVFGIISFTMQRFGIEMFFIVKWLLIVTGILGVLLFALSESLRRKAHFLISTNFYANKYEYRGEWLKLSENLEGAQSEVQIVQALNKVLYDCLYTKKIYIWLGDSENKDNFRLISGHVDASLFNGCEIAFDDTLIEYLIKHPFFHIASEEKPSDWKKIYSDKSDIIQKLELALITPISINRNICGLIGIGEEYTGEEYSYDDFDLLSAIGSQTAAALLSIRMTEKIAEVREQEAWNKLSAFVLHDIKNAATMLSLLLENAPNHINEPEFQNDMLELVADTLSRMKRVEDRLNLLKSEEKLELKNILLLPLIENTIQSMKKRFPEVHFSIETDCKLYALCDFQLLTSIIENVFINAAQAQDYEGAIQIFIRTVKESGNTLIQVVDHGPGIKEELLPDKLFEPFKTTKKGGSGIGLWQANKLLKKMNGTITAENLNSGGARFSIKLPAENGVE